MRKRDSLFTFSLLIFFLFCISFSFGDIGIPHVAEVSGVDKIDFSSYTGDIGFSIPVASIPGRGEFGYQVNLDYSSGGIYKTVNSDNFESQSSWVGLGFNLEVPYVYVSREMPYGGDLSGSKINEEFFLSLPGIGNGRLIPFEEEKILTSNGEELDIDYCSQFNDMESCNSIDICSWSSNPANCLTNYGPRRQYYKTEIESFAIIFRDYSNSPNDGYSWDWENGGFYVKTIDGVSYKFTHPRKTVSFYQPSENFVGEDGIILGPSVSNWEEYVDACYNLEGHTMPVCLNNQELFDEVKNKLGSNSGWIYNIDSNGDGSWDNQDSPCNNGFISSLNNPPQPQFDEYGFNIKLYTKIINGEIVSSFDSGSARAVCQRFYLPNNPDTNKGDVPGVINDYSTYRWDVSEISNLDDNKISFDYEDESFYVWNLLYTKSYLKKITDSVGNKIIFDLNFDYGDNIRKDVYYGEERAGYNDDEIPPNTVQERYLNSIRVLTKDMSEDISSNQFVSKYDFNYGYLHSGQIGEYGSKYDKLILENIEKIGNNNEKLITHDFEYYNNEDDFSSFGDDLDSSLAIESMYWNPPLAPSRNEIGYLKSVRYLSGGKINFEYEPKGKIFGQTKIELDVVTTDGLGNSLREENKNMGLLCSDFNQIWTNYDLNNPPTGIEEGTELRDVVWHYQPYRQGMYQCISNGCSFDDSRESDELCFFDEFQNNGYRLLEKNVDNGFGDITSEKYYYGEVGSEGGQYGTGKAVLNLERYPYYTSKPDSVQIGHDRSYVELPAGYGGSISYFCNDRLDSECNVDPACGDKSKLDSLKYRSEVLNGEGILIESTDLSFCTPSSYIDSQNQIDVKRLEVKEELNWKEGIEYLTKYVYEPTNGLITESISYGPNGKEIKAVTEWCHENDYHTMQCFDVYISEAMVLNEYLMKNNLLSLPHSIKTYVDGTLKSSDEKQYRAWQFNPSNLDLPWHIASEKIYSGIGNEKRLLSEVIDMDHGFVTHSKDGKGNSILYDYTDDWLIKSITDAQGKIVVANYDDYLRLHSFKDANGLFTFYDYDSFGRLSGITSPGLDFQSKAYDYFLSGEFINEDNPNFISTKIYSDVDEYSEVQKHFDGIGNVHQIHSAVDDTGKVVVKVDEFNEINKLKHTYVPYETENSMSKSYDENVVNDFGKLILGEKSIYDSVAEGFLDDGLNPYYLKDIDSKNLEGNEEYSIFFYEKSPEAKIEKVFLPKQYNEGAENIDCGLNNPCTQYEYSSPLNPLFDCSGNQFCVRKTDENGNKVISRYDKYKNLVELENSLGFVETYEYDSFGRLLKIFNSQGILISDNQYNSLGQLTDSWDVNGGLTHYDYDDNGNVEFITYSDGTVLQNVYDSLDRILLIKINDVVVMEYYYDTFNSQPLLSPKFSFDNSDETMELPCDSRDCDGDDGGLISCGDGVVNQIEECDCGENLEECSLKQLGYKTCQDFGYVGGNLKCLSNCEYDFSECIGYCSDGTMVGSCSNDLPYYCDGQQGLIEECNLCGCSGVLDFCDISSGQCTLFDENSCGYGTGKLCSIKNFMEDIPVEIRYTYDQRGNVIKVWESLDGGEWAITEYGYDIADNVVRIDLPNGKLIEYQYDKLGRVEKMFINSEEVSFDYETRAGLLKQINYPNEAIQYFEYNDRDWLETTEARGPDVQQEYPYHRSFFRESYLYDNVGNVVSITDVKRGIDYPQVSADTALFVYDGAYQLLDVVNRGGGVSGDYYTVDGFDFDSVNYEYDMYGNRINRQTQQLINQKGVAISTFSDYEYDLGNKLTSVLNDGIECNYDYDSLGKITSKICSDNTEINYDYYSNGKLKTVEMTDGTVLNFVYDGLGRRVLKEVEQGEQKHTYKYIYGLGSDPLIVQEVIY